MAIKFTKANYQLLRDAIGKAEVEKEALEEAIDDFVGKIEELFAPVSEAVADLNQANEDVRSILAECITDWRTEWEDKSEKWQESERGQASSTFIDTWEEFADSLSEVSVDPPDDLHVENLPDYETEPAEEVDA